MCATQRRFEPAVIERLFTEPYRFDYFQAVRLLELWLRRRGLPDRDLVPRFLRFKNSTSLNFPASQLEAIETEPRGLGRDPGSLDAAVRARTLRYVRITPAFMGLLSGNGALPVHYTERIAEHEVVQREEGPRVFLDVFSNRSLAMFYEAWRKYRLPFKYQLTGKDEFLPLLLALAGLGHEALRKRLAGPEDGTVRDETLAYFAAAIRHRPTSALQLARVLSEYFGKPVQAEQFIGSWYEVPLAQQTVLGSMDAVLGAGAMAGARVWQRHLRLRLVIGPLDAAGFSAFLPGGQAARALRSLLALFTGVSLEYEIELVLRAADVRPVSLADGSLGRLGWDAFMVSGPQAGDRNDVCYLMHAV
ncbi:type VI secretion system baseplate subunit TssG [Massilia agilis]|uniref:Type VI secretion system baseplate subunit TssG n=1 Tax=Massilia agilis TaxID=1811226 RepID=A0ABT2D5N1_9BURK|nr:type VI secretion system baseplate subunit TssG [Massilia agilis]MCS0806596.1 type VI secretion system baseplate subunit TssG [Massilia agilis]